MAEKVDIFMPLYLADYLADTTDLTAEEHGAYLLLLMALWRQDGRLENHPHRLARAARVPVERWPVVWEAVERFFDVADGWVSQGRLTKELDKARTRKAVAAENGRRGAAAKHGKAMATPWPGHGHPVATTVANAWQKPDSSPSPSESLSLSALEASDPDPDARAIPVAPYTAPTPEPYRRVDAFAAATSADFDRVYDKYPRKDARKRAGLAFQALAAGYPGGEKALADAILAAFPAMLKRAPYNGPNDKRPFLETVLVERRWEDQGSAPDGATAATAKPSPGPTYRQPRCNLHEENPRARASNVDWCPSCREHKARNGTREGAPKTAAEILTGDPP